MTHAEILRKHANLALKEGGMYYSGEYLSNMAEVAESLESENAKLRKMVARMWPMATRTKRCTFADRLELRAEIDELGIEVDE